MLRPLSGGSMLVFLSGGSRLVDCLTPLTFVQFAVCNYQLCFMTNTKIKNKMNASGQFARCRPSDIFHSWGHLIRSIPFLMSGHLNFNFFKALGTLLFNTNLNNGCPNMIYQHSGQAHKHFSHRFHGRSFLADVQTWELKLKFVFQLQIFPITKRAGVRVLS